MYAEEKIKVCYVARFALPGPILEPGLALGLGWMGDIVNRQIVN